MVRNTAIILINQYNQVLLLKHRHSGQWMTPGGKIETYDPSLLSALKREFTEETGEQFPRLIGRMSIYKYKPTDTMIFKGFTIDSLLFNKSTEEAIDLKWICWNDLFDMNLKGFVRESFIKMIHDGFLPEAYHALLKNHSMEDKEYTRPNAKRLLQMIQTKPKPEEFITMYNVLEHIKKARDRAKRHTRGKRHTRNN